MNDYYIVYFNLKGWNTAPLPEYTIKSIFRKRYFQAKVEIKESILFNNILNYLFVEGELKAYLFSSKEEQTKFLEKSGIL
jgi:hypothetical protein